MSTKMTPADLKYNVEQTRYGSYFFTRSSMQFFGDRMANYGVRSATIETYDDPGVECWELYRRHPVKYGLQASAYFSKSDYSRIFQKINTETQA